MINLLNDLPARANAEIFTEGLLRMDVRIERVASTGQFTPADKPLRQGHDEWVLLLAGLAGLRIDGEDERHLRPGVLIAAHRDHWVTVDRNERTYYLAGRARPLNSFPMWL